MDGNGPYVFPIFLVCRQIFSNGIAVFSAATLGKFYGTGDNHGTCRVGGRLEMPTNVPYCFDIDVTGHVAFYLPYNVGDKELMLLPVFLVWGIWVGLGFQVLKDLVAQRSRSIIR